MPDHGRPTAFADHGHAAAPAPHHAAEPGGAPDEHAGNGDHAGASGPEMMGHGGHHRAGSMTDMVRDMRNRFLVAAVLSVPILLWSPIGPEVLGFSTAAPPGLRDDVSVHATSLAPDASPGPQRLAARSKCREQSGRSGTTRGPAPSRAHT